MTAVSRYPSPAVQALVLGLAMAAVVGTALGFEHVGGYIPCKLCLEQRLPYYAGVPVALATAGAALVKAPGAAIRAGFLLVAALMTYSLYLAVFHAGVEWGWWPGPADCAAATDTGIVTDAGSLLDAIETTVPPACDEAAGRFLGLSFAGWNAVASLVFAAAAWRAVFGRR